MAELVIRSGTVEDAPSLHALGQAVVPATYDAIDAAYAEMMLREWWSVDSFKDMLSRIPHFVAETEGRVVGVANIGGRGNRRVMWKLYVHPDHQGRQVGSGLLSAVIDHVGDEPLWLECVDGNEAATGFYASRGFVEVERVPTPPYPDDIWMRREP